VSNLVVPGHVFSELLGVRFSGFGFEWDMAYNNLPSTTVQAVIYYSYLIWLVKYETLNFHGV
jgi:hypothetical protein